jgi:hypothetical protein
LAAAADVNLSVKQTAVGGGKLRKLPAALRLCSPSAMKLSERATSGKKTDTLRAIFPDGADTPLRLDQLVERVSYPSVAP